MRTLAGLILGCALLAGCGESRAPEPITPIEANHADFDSQAIAQTLAQALRYRTISAPGYVEAAQPEFAAFRDFLAAEFPLLHDRLDLTELGGHSLMMSWPGSDAALKDIVLLAHQDVVPVEPGTEDRWTHPAFDGVIADGYVWGRGTLDMKAHLITLLTALEAHMAAGFEPARTIHIVMGADEEVGGRGAQAAAALLAERGRRAWFALDEGGFVIMDNPITQSPAAMIAVSEKGYMTVEITARARGGHSSTPPAQTSVDKLAEALGAIRSNPFDHGLDGGPTHTMLAALGEDAEGVEGFVLRNSSLFAPLLRGQFMDDDASRALIGTTIAPTVINGGIKDNVLPQETRALVNLRLHPRDTIESALAHLRASVAHIEGVEIALYGEPNNPPGIAQTEGPAWQIIAGAAHSHAPQGAPVVPFMIAGTTDIRAFAGVADNLYRFAPVWGSLDAVSRIHGDDERIAVEDLGRMASYFHTVIETAGSDRDAP